MPAPRWPLTRRFGIVSDHRPGTLSRMQNLPRIVSVMLMVLAVTLSAGAGVNPSAFPRALPEEVGMSTERMQEVMTEVRRWIAADEIVGAILIVIRHGKLVWHEAAGVDCRERGREMDRDAITLMRSMTKPLTGMAILMLVEEGKLGLDDPVAQYLAGWDLPETRAITIRQLLTHTSGITGDMPVRQYPSLREAAIGVAQRGVGYAPGTGYQYSDANSGTLAAILGVVAGMDEARFVEERILQPLGMADSYLVEVPAGDLRRERTASGYRRNRDGTWRLYRWGGEPVSPYWGGSGGLYATGLDYARFLQAVMDGGTFQGHRLLRPETIRQFTAPGNHTVYSAAERAALPRFYGLHLYAWTDEFGGDPSPFSPGSFGHGGREGTYAWADPAQGLICLFLTQSNGNETRPRIPPLIYAAIID